MKEGQPSFEIAFQGLIDSYEKEEVHAVLKDHYLFKQPRIKIPNTTYLKRIAELEAKPTSQIHSDPAVKKILFEGGDNLDIKKSSLVTIDEMEMCHKFLEARRNGDITDQECIKAIIEVLHPPKPPTPQTGRTYTEGEMEKAWEAGMRAEYFKNTRDAKYVTFEDWIKKHNLKQNPKP